MLWLDRKRHRPEEKKAELEAPSGLKKAEVFPTGTNGR
jgi:hypothetical protein